MRNHNHATREYLPKGASTRVIPRVTTAPYIALAGSLAVFAILAWVTPALTIPADDKSLVDQISLSTTDVFPSRIYLVKLEMLGPKSSRVLHVYAGPDRLKGKTIESEWDSTWRREILESYAGRMGTPMPPPGPLMRGDVGLFLLREDNKIISVLSPSAESGFTIAPLIKEHDQFERWVVLAEVAEAIYREPDKTRLRKIDEFLRCGDVAKAYTAFWYLKMAKEPRLMDYMLELTRERSLPLEVQMDLNTHLRKKKKGWAGSGAELDLARRWFTEPWNGTRQPRDYLVERNPPKLYYLGEVTEEEALAGWFHTAAAWYSAEQLIDLAVKGLANPKRSPRFRERIIEVIENSAANAWEGKNRDQAYLHLVRQTKRGPNVLVNCSGGVLRLRAA